MRRKGGGGVGPGAVEDILRPWDRARDEWGGEGRRPGRRSGRRQREARGGRFDPGHITVAQAAARVAGVVARQGRSQGGLTLSRGLAGGAVAGFQHHGGGGEVPARLEGVLHGQAQPAQVAAVDLGEAEVEVPAAGQKRARGANGFGAVTRLTVQEGAPVHPDRQRIEPAFNEGDGRHRLRRHAWRTGLRQRQDGDQIEHDACPSGYDGGCGRVPGTAGPVSSAPQRARRAAACTRVRTSRARQARERCSSTVRGDTPRRVAMPAEDRPVAASCRHSHWRSDRASRASAGAE